MSPAIPATFCARSRVIRSWFSGSYEMFPVRSAFSRPPMRCSSPGVPGTAHGRASVCSSRRYGRNSSPAFGSVAKVGRQIRERVELRQEPRLGAVREVRVGEEIDGRAVLERDPRGLDRRVEAVRRRARRDDRHRRLAVAPVHHHQQVTLLRLGRHPGRRPGALDVADQERQLEHDREPDGLGLEDDARPGRGRDAERAAERSADRGAGAAISSSAWNVRTPKSL